MQDASLPSLAASPHHQNRCLANVPAASKYHCGSAKSFLLVYQTTTISGLANWIWCRVAKACRSLPQLSGCQGDAMVKIGQIHHAIKPCCQHTIRIDLPPQQTAHPADLHRGRRLTMISRAPSCHQKTHVASGMFKWTAIKLTGAAARSDKLFSDQTTDFACGWLRSMRNCLSGQISIGQIQKYHAMITGLAGGETTCPSTPHQPPSQPARLT